MPSPRMTLVEIDHDPTHGCRLSWFLDAYENGRVRVALFARLNMTSNARCGLWVRP